MALAAALSLSLNMLGLHLGARLMNLGGAGSEVEIAQPVTWWVQDGEGTALHADTFASRGRANPPSVVRQVVRAQRVAHRGPVFYSGRQLTRQPVPVSAPDIARDLHLDAPFGMARLTLFIDRDGSIVHIRVRSHVGFSRADLKRLRTLFERTRFLPGYREGVAVASSVDIEINLSELLRH